MAETIAITMTLLDDVVDTATSSDMTVDAQAEMVAMLEKYGTVTDVANV